jgi:hypothetical protein
VGNLVPPQSHEVTSCVVKAMAVQKVLMDHQRDADYCDVTDPRAANLTGDLLQRRLCNICSMTMCLAAALFIKVGDDLLLRDCGWGQRILL